MQANNYYSFIDWTKATLAIISSCMLLGLQTLIDPQTEVNKDKKI